MCLSIVYTHTFDSIDGCGDMAKRPNAVACSGGRNYVACLASPQVSVRTRDTYRAVLMF